ncbi:MAG: hypothetical protein JWM57_1639 [Phycisphaerales bacterium]|nr:hypothetical protein [Phycisphaerales bacterium]
MPVMPMKPPVAESAQAREARLASELYAANMRAAYDGGPPASAATGQPTGAVQAHGIGQPAIARTPIAVQSAGPAEHHGFDLEQLLGLKFAGWVGAIILVIGLALGVKFAYDQGWLGGMPNSVRCLMIAAAGVAMIAAGEWVYRRINRLSATGPYGVGVSMLFLAAFAGQAWYGLYTQLTASALMAIAAAVGMAIAARADLVSIASLAVLGATIGPLFMGATQHAPPGFRLYLLAVQVLAIGLCAWRATPKWWVLRGLALVMIFIAAGASGELDAPPAPFDLGGVIFVLVSAILFQGELIFTTYRRRPGPWGEPTRGAIFTLLSTAVLTLELMAFFHYQTPSRRAQVLLWAALTAAALGRILARRTVGLIQLGRGYYVQAVLLLTLAIPVALSGPSMLIGWMALACGLAALAAMARDRLAAIGAAFVWLIAAIGVVVWANNYADSANTWLTIAGEAIRASVVIAAVLALAGHVTALGLRRSRPANRAIHAPDFGFGTLIDLAAIIAFSTVLVEFTSPPFATRVGLAYALLLWAAALVPGLAVLGTISTALLAAVAVKWAALDVLRERFLPYWTSEGRPFFNAQMATGVAIAVVFALQGWSFRRRSAANVENPSAIARGETAWAGMLTVALILIGFGLTVNVDHAITLAHRANHWLDWPGYSAQQLIGTAQWAGLVVVWLLAVRTTVTTASLRRDVVRIARVAAYLLAAKFIAIDVIGVSLDSPVPTPGLLLNLRMLVAGLLIVLLVLLGRPRTDVAADGFTGLAILAILLVAGSAEVDRYAMQQTSGPVWIVRQVAWSIYWALLAVATLVIGFALRQQMLRMVSLGLLGITLLKVTLVDMSGAGTGWRILSFLALGALLLLTSVLYGKFAKRIIPAEGLL